MAKKLDKVKTTMGQLIRVANQKQKPNENDKYVSVHVEDESGKDEKCLLFTEIQMADMEKIEFPEIMDNMILGRMYRANINKRNTYLVKVRNTQATEMILRISETQLKDADQRSIRNPEDLTEKGFITNLLD